MSNEDEPPDRVLFFEVEGLTRIVRDCHDVDEIDQVSGFVICPICGGPRVAEGAAHFLDHDQSYDGQKLH